jgi:pyruvate/2-oxoglutarate dehydrogenase complex dihydrolipoamide acyltransferase (E2) component
MIRKDVTLNDDGTVTCACNSKLVFLPPDLDHAARGSVNHAGCPAAEAGASPAGPDIDGKYETINFLADGAVEDFYASHAWDPDKRQFKSAPRATPAAKEHAEAHGLDLSEIKGSGKDGAVTKADVEAFLARDAEPATP